MRLVVLKTSLINAIQFVWNADLHWTARQDHQFNQSPAFTSRLGGRRSRRSGGAHSGNHDATVGTLRQRRPVASLFPWASRFADRKVLTHRRKVCDSRTQPGQEVLESWQPMTGHRKSLSLMVKCNFLLSATHRPPRRSCGRCERAAHGIRPPVYNGNLSFPDSPLCVVDFACTCRASQFPDHHG